jgi:hypothetical protein
MRVRSVAENASGCGFSIHTRPRPGHSLVRHFSRLEFLVVVIVIVVIIIVIVIVFVIVFVFVFVFVLGLRLARVQLVKLVELIGVRQFLGHD